LITCSLLLLDRLLALTVFERSAQWSQEDNLYLHSSMKKPKSLSKTKGIVIESVGWDKVKPATLYISFSLSSCLHALQSNPPDAKDTGMILIGTRSGQIFEATISSDAREKAWKQVSARGSCFVMLLFYVCGSTIQLPYRIG
jgi:hypothetical protein